MTTLKKSFSTLLYITSLLAPLTLLAATPSVTTRDVDVRIAGDYLNVGANLVLDSLHLGSNQQMFITPVVSSRDSQRIELPSLLVSGRNMHISYQRGVLNSFPEIKSRNIVAALERKNGSEQSYEYLTRLPIQPWMKTRGTVVTFVYDSCGCGSMFGRAISPAIPVFTNPVKEMQAYMLTPEVTDLPVEIHEGKARVQFEVDRTVLHPTPFVCRNGQRLDNRAQLGIIDDSVKYALSDPNVELAGISICGYASPESPYLHNVELASGRSQALAEYLADRYHLPKGSVNYSYVPENWGEFREQTLESNEISEPQRALLLELIDSPASTPEQYDRKEWLLKSDPKYADLYKKLILPEWFPRLRATTFAISTRLKPMSDTELAKIIDTTPGKMSLNQMFRVARLYPEGSPEFNRIINIALTHYPSDPTAIINAATAAVNDGDYAAARRLIARAGDTPEANNIRGIIACADEDYPLAASYFEKASSLPSAQHNLQLLK